MLIHELLQLGEAVGHIAGLLEQLGLAAVGFDAFGLQVGQNLADQ